LTTDSQNLGGVEKGEWQMEASGAGVAVDVGVVSFGLLIGVMSFGLPGGTDLGRRNVPR
jgi:hypothetical protein